mgnify:CR=1 FL=1
MLSLTKASVEGLSQSLMKARLTLEALRPHYPEGRLARFVEEGAGHTLTPLMARVGLAFLEHWLEAR